MNKILRVYITVFYEFMLYNYLFQYYHVTYMKLNDNLLKYIYITLYVRH